MKNLLFITGVFFINYVINGQNTFTIPHTFTSGTTISSTEMNTNFSAITTQINSLWSAVSSLSSGSTGSTAFAEPSTGQALACNGSGTYSDLIFDSNVNSSPLYDETTGRFTVTESGIYLFTAYIEQTFSMGYNFRCKINGANYFAYSYSSKSPDIQKLNAGDVVQCEHYCDTAQGSTETISSSSYIVISLLK